MSADHEAVYARMHARIAAEIACAPCPGSVTVFVWSDGSLTVSTRATAGAHDTPAGTVPVVIYVRGERRMVLHRMTAASQAPHGDRCTRATRPRASGEAPCGASGVGENGGQNAQR